MNEIITVITARLLAVLQALENAINSRPAVAGPGVFNPSVMTGIIAGVSVIVALAIASFTIISVTAMCQHHDQARRDHELAMKQAQNDYIVAVKSDRHHHELDLDLPRPSGSAQGLPQEAGQAG